MSYSVFFLFFSIYCCPAVVLYEVLKGEGGLSCSDSIIIISNITIITAMPDIP